MFNFNCLFIIFYEILQAAVFCYGAISINIIFGLNDRSNVLPLYRVSVLLLEATLSAVTPKWKILFYSLQMLQRLKSLFTE